MYDDFTAGDDEQTTERAGPTGEDDGSASTHGGATDRGAGPRALRRRALLASTAAAGALALAGCLGGGGDTAGADDERGDGGSDGNDGGSDDGGSGSGGDCADMEGSPTRYQDDAEAFSFTFDYPDTWEPYNEDIADAGSIYGAFIGHVGTSTTSSYPTNIAINEIQDPMPAEDRSDWVNFPGFSPGEPFEYGGETVERGTMTVGGTAFIWRFSLPAGDGSYYPVKVQATTESTACAETVAGIARDVMDSFAPR